MISTVGLPLDRAKKLLAEDGVTVSVEETRSKKGVEGGTDARVIRQTMPAAAAPATRKEAAQTIHERRRPVNNRPGPADNGLRAPPGANFC